MRHLALALALALAFALGVTPARADVVEPPPTDCPPGTVGVSGRSGGWCAPSVCNDAELTCNPGTECSAEPVPLCVIETTATGSRPGPMGPIEWSETVVRANGPCAEDGSCPSGGQCRRERRCISEGAASSGCAVAAPGTGGGWLAALALGLALIGLTRRR